MTKFVGCVIFCFDLVRFCQTILRCSEVIHVWFISSILEIVVIDVFGITKSTSVLIRMEKLCISVALCI